MRLTILALVTALAGCTTVVDKPAEDNVPTDGKADSFRDPTEHGSLRFDTASRGAISDDEMFHAWTFALSGDAELALEVSSRDRNLDTVMYLYRRDAGSSSWGRYVEQNDDHEGLQSRIAGSYGEGEYRIIVKGHKSYHRGSFTLLGTCEGSGCASPTPEGSVVVPPETGFTASCIAELETALGSKVVSGDGFDISPEAAEGFPPEVLVATAHYRDLSDYRDYFSGDELDDFTFEASITKLEDGAVVTMADGGDESTTDYAFNGEGKLLAYYVHNQSPWTGYYCGSDGDESAEEPTEDCLMAWIRTGPRDSGLEEGGATYEPDGTDELTSLMHAAVAAYQELALEGDSDVEIRITYKRWDGADGGRGSEMLLSAEGHEMVAYTVVESEYDEPWVVFESSENGEPSMLCTQPTT